MNVRPQQRTHVPSHKQFPKPNTTQHYFAETTERNHRNKVLTIGSDIPILFSCLRSKTKQQSTSNKQDLPECNPAKIQVNTAEIAQKHYSLMQWTKLLWYTRRITKHPAPVATGCTVAVAMAACNLKCKQTTVKTVQQDGHVHSVYFPLTQYFLLQKLLRMKETKFYQHILFTTIVSLHQHLLVNDTNFMPFYPAKINPVHAQCICTQREEQYEFHTVLTLFYHGNLHGNTQS